MRTFILLVSDRYSICAASDLVNAYVEDVSNPGGGFIWSNSKVGAYILSLQEHLVWCGLANDLPEFAFNALCGQAFRDNWSAKDTTHVMLEYRDGAFYRWLERESWSLVPGQRLNVI